LTLFKPQFGLVTMLPPTVGFYSIPYAVHSKCWTYTVLYWW